MVDDQHLARVRAAQNAFYAAWRPEERPVIATVRCVEARDGHNWENWRDRLRDALTWVYPVPQKFYYETELIDLAHGVGDQFGHLPFHEVRGRPPSGGSPARTGRLRPLGHRLRASTRRFWSSPSARIGIREGRATYTSACSTGFSMSAASSAATQASSVWPRAAECSIARTVSSRIPVRDVSSHMLSTQA